MEWCIQFLFLRKKNIYKLLLTVRVYYGQSSQVCKVGHTHTHAKAHIEIAIYIFKIEITERTKKKIKIKTENEEWYSVAGHTAEHSNVTVR